MLIRVVAACALLAPAAALAQVRPAAAPVTVEIVASGEIDAPANSITMTATYSATGPSEAAAEKARDAKLGEILAALQVQGIPASAVTELAEDDPAHVATTVVSSMEDAVDEADADAKGKKNDTPPEYTATAGRSIKVASIAQAKAAREALEKLDVAVGEPDAALDDYPATMRQAKTLALRNARADADAYAKEMGLRVTRVARISEAGNQLFLPGLQDKLQRMMTSGPVAMQNLFKPKPGLVHVEAGLIVTFEMAP